MTAANDASETTTTAPPCPPFARSYPEDPQLVTLLAAFAQGFVIIGVGIDGGYVLERRA